MTLDIDRVIDGTQEPYHLWGRFEILATCTPGGNYRKFSKNYEISKFTGTLEDFDKFFAGLGLIPLIVDHEHLMNGMFFDGRDLIVKVISSKHIVDPDCPADPDDYEYDEQLVIEESESNTIYVRGIEIISRYASPIEKIEKFFDDNTERLENTARVNRGTVFYLSAGMAGIELIPAPRMIVSPLKETNYSEIVRKKHKDVVEQIGSPEPKGKIVIYQGSPGTGKTYLIRNLIHEMKNVFMVLIQPSQVAALSDPAFIKTLMYQASAGLPIVFVVEDADQLLSPRSTNNISGISTLLNLGDGILGSLLDTRIVASTNVKIEEFDEAIVRPGRLLHLINVDKLTVKEGRTAAEAISQDVKVDITLPMSIAQIYQLVNEKKEEVL